MKKVAAGILGIILVITAIAVSIASSFVIALEKVPKEIINDLQLKPEITTIVGAIIKHDAWIQIGIWLILTIPTAGIVILLRKEIRALSVTLSAANLASGLLIATSINKMEIRLDAIEPLIQTIIRRLNVEAAIFIATGSALAIAAIIAHTSKTRIEKTYIRERTKKKLKGILKRGSTQKPAKRQTYQTIKSHHLVT